MMDTIWRLKWELPPLEIHAGTLAEAYVLAEKEKVRLSESADGAAILGNGRFLPDGFYTCLHYETTVFDYKCLKYDPGSSKGRNVKVTITNCKKCNKLLSEKEEVI